VRLTVTAAGYAIRDLEVRAQFGKLVPHDVFLDRVAREFADLKLRAEFEGGAFFTGALMLRAGGPSVLVWFREGRALNPFRVPVGQILLQVSGAHPAGEWWSPAAANQAIDVRSPEIGHEQEYVIRLVGQRVNLNVRLEDGSPAHHFDFQVAGSKSGAGWDRGWEARFRKLAARFGVHAEDAERVKPFIYLAPGEYELLVNVAGRGYARQSVSVRGSTGAQEVDLRITPGDKFEARTGR